MAALTFDDAPEITRKPDGPPPRPGEPGAPSVPISRPDPVDPKLLPPQVPISKPQAGDTAGLTFEDAPEASEAQKSVARIRDITKGKLAKQPYTPGPLDLIADAGTLSLSRPISAAVGTLYDKLAGNYPNASANEIYQANVGYMNDRARQAEKNTPFAPVVGAAAQLPVTLATGGGSGFLGAGRGAASATTKRVMGDAAAQGAVEGAAQNADTPAHAAKGAVVNAALSAGTAGVIDKGTKTVMPAARRGAAAEAEAARGTSPDEIRTRAKDLYTDLDNQGIAYDANQTTQLYTGLHKLRNTSVYVPSSNPALVDHYDDLLRRARGDMTFNDLDNARSAIAKLARGQDESTRAAAGAMLNEIDQLVGKVKPALNPSGVDVGTSYQQARQLWKAKSLVEDAMWHSDNVDRKVAINSSVDPNKATKAEYGAVEKRVSKPGNYDPYSDEQRDILSRVVRGDKSQNALAAIGNTATGRFAPWAAGAAGLAVPAAMGVSKNIDPLLATTLGAAAGVSAAGGVNQVGRAFQRGAANIGEGNVAALMRNITGSAPPVPGAAVSRDDLVKILFAQDLARMAPRVASQEIGNRKKREE